MTSENLSKAIYALLESHPAVNLHRNPIRITVQDGIAVLEGEVDGIIPKRLAPRLAAGMAGVGGVLDRLRVIPGERRGDGAIRDSVYRALAEEPVFNGCIIRTVAEAPGQHLPPPQDTTPGGYPGGGWIELAIAEGVVTLAGCVQSLSHKRLADVLAWWAPGTMDVDNRLHVVPPEQDTDEEITDALRIVLEKDPSLNASQIQIRTHQRTVTLRGLLRSREQRDIAEQDAWYILGVHQVNNEIEVRP